MKAMITETADVGDLQEYLYVQSEERRPEISAVTVFITCTNWKPFEKRVLSKYLFVFL